MAALSTDVRTPELLRGSVKESPDFDVFDYERSAVAALVGLCGSSVASEWAQLPVKSDGTDSRAPRFVVSNTASNECDSNASSPSDSPRVVRRKDSGSLSTNNARFQCRYPGCSKMYASTDAVRKHCRKRHFEWLRRLDQLATHERHMSKPALYCSWSGAEGPAEVDSAAS